MGPRRDLRVLAAILLFVLAIVQFLVGGWRGLLLGFGISLFVWAAWEDRPRPTDPQGSPAWGPRILRDRVAIVGSAIALLLLSFIGWSAWDRRPRITELSFSPRSPFAAEEVRIGACAKGGESNLPFHLRVQANVANDGSRSLAWETIAELEVGCVRGEEAPTWATLEYEDGPHRVRVQARRSTEAWESGLVREETYELLPRRPPPAEPTSPSNGATVSSATGTVHFCWQPALRAEQYQVRVYRGPDRTLPILNKTFSNSTLSFTHTFRTDELELYWTVTAINNVGSNESPPVRFVLDRKRGLQEELLSANDVPSGWAKAPVPDHSAFEDANYCGIEPNLAGLKAEVRVAFESLPLVGERVDHGVAVFKPDRAKAFLDDLRNAQSRCRRTEGLRRGVGFVGTVKRRPLPLPLRDQADQGLAFTERVTTDRGITVNGEVIYARKGDVVYILAVSASGAGELVPEANRGLADHLATIAIAKLTPGFGSC